VKKKAVMMKKQTALQQDVDDCFREEKNDAERGHASSIYTRMEPRGFQIDISTPIHTISRLSSY
jgi:hypothetical protein